MRILDKINKLKEQESDILTRITQLGMSTYSTSNSVCEFCGKERVESFPGYFKPCDCEEGQKLYRAYVSAVRDRTDLEGMLELVRDNIEYFNSQAQRLLEKSNIGKRFQSRTFENFEGGGDVYEIALEYADSFETNAGEGLILTGTVGTGKTHLAAAIVNRVVQMGIPARFLTSIELFETLKDFSQETLQKIKTVPLLVIDDLAKEKETDWNREKLFEVINSRYENCLPVIITTNATPGELEESVGKATFSRLAEMCRWVSMTGKDWRLK